MGRKTILFGEGGGKKKKIYGRGQKELVADSDYPKDDDSDYWNGDHPEMVTLLRMVKEPFLVDKK